MVFLSRDGRIRADDLSVPKYPGVDRSGLVRAKTAGQSLGRTAMDCSKRRRTRDGRAMRAFPCMVEAAAYRTERTNLPTSPDTVLVVSQNGRGMTRQVVLLTPPVAERR